MDEFMYTDPKKVSKIKFEINPMTLESLTTTVRPEQAVRGEVGKIIDKVFVNETKKTTTVKFVDGTTQTVKCSEEDVFDPIVGVAIAVSSFVFGSKKNFHEIVERKLKAAKKIK